MPRRAITLDNQLVVLATSAADAGRYHVEAVNEMTGENVTSPAVYLSISGKKPEIRRKNVFFCSRSLINMARVSSVCSERHAESTQTRSLFFIP